MGKVAAGDMNGEVGVLCYRPQPYTDRTTKLCQILRLNGTSLMNIMEVNKEEGNVVMSNLCKKLNELQSSTFDQPNIDPGLEQGGTGGSCLNAGFENQQERYASKGEADINFLGSKAIEKSERGRPPKNGISTAEDGQPALHEAVPKGHVEMVKILVEGGPGVNKPDARAWRPKAFAENQGSKS